MYSLLLDILRLLRVWRLFAVVDCYGGGSDRPYAKSKLTLYKHKMKGEKKMYPSQGLLTRLSPLLGTTMVVAAVSGGDPSRESSREALFVFIF